ncbi:glucans biosynthesis protein MdoC [Parafrankia sp. FMc2]|uniref:glucans biosynthesis protein MdoC n=1 Tax=Parafrankia sp. FMc2 TaxID=3233196 RepID=UPI0034D5F878
MEEQKAPSALGVVHYHHMDALRGAFMMVGVFVHTATLGDDPIFDGIAYSSSLFRMEGFFLISGFLSAMLVGKYGSGRTIRRRFAAVGTPLLITLVLLNPPALWLIYNFHNDPDISLLDYVRGNTIPSPAGELSWYLHLWFLISLLVYALCAPAAVSLLSRLTSASPYQWATANRIRCMTTITLFVLVTTIVIRGGHRAVVEPVVGTGTHAVLLKHTLDFLPYFLLGVLLYLDRQRLLPSFQRPAPIFLAVTGLALLASKQEWVGALSVGTGLVMTETIFTIPLLATIFAASARLVSRPRPAWRYLADASYTVYLFHFLWIYIFATVLSLDPSLSTPYMLLITVLTFCVTLAIHHFIILRSKFLRMVLNGKFPSKDRRDARGSTAPDPVTAGNAGVDLEQTQPIFRSGKVAVPDVERTQHLNWTS